MSEDEEWRAIPGHEHYEASSEGRIRSLPHATTFVGRWGTLRTHRYSGKIKSLKAKPNGWGAFYLVFVAGHDQTVHVNRAVCEAFHGAPPTPQHEAAHLDGDSLNNREDNLCWATPKENGAHKVLHGTNPQGERNAAARLADAVIEPIFDQYISGNSSTEIGAALGVGKGTINQVLRRAAWKHISVSEDKVAAASLQAARNIENARRGNNERRSRLANHLPKSEGLGGLRA